MQRVTTRRLLRLIPLAAALVFAACDDPSQPLGLDAIEAQQSAAISAARPGAPAIASVDLGNDTLVISGMMQLIPVTVTNPGRAALKDAAVRAVITQPGGSRPVASSPVLCPGSPTGVVPAGATCVVQLAVTISNIVAGTGTLVPGPAQFETRLIAGKKGNEIDSRSDAITLIDSTPYISLLQVASSDFLLETPVDYTISIRNPGGIKSNVAVQAMVMQGTAARAAGGTVVICPNPNGLLPNGTCTFSYTAVASNVSDGTGELAAGAASLVVQLWHGTTQIDADTVPVMLSSSAL